MMGRFGRRYYNECLCRKFCARPGSGWRKFVKRHTRRMDRVEGKLEMNDQLEDYWFGVDPD